AAQCLGSRTPLVRTRRHRRTGSGNRSGRSCFRRQAEFWRDAFGVRARSAAPGRYRRIARSSAAPITVVSARYGAARHRRFAEPQNRRAVIGYTPPLRLPGFGTPGLTPPTFDVKPPPKLDVGPTLPKPGTGLDFPGTTLPPPGPDKPGPRADAPQDDWWKRSE